MVSLSRCPGIRLNPDASSGESQSQTDRLIEALLSETNDVDFPPSPQLSDLAGSMYIRASCCGNALAVSPFFTRAAKVDI